MADEMNKGGLFGEFRDGFEEQISNSGVKPYGSTTPTMEDFRDLMDKLRKASDETVGIIDGRFVLTMKRNWFKERRGFRERLPRKLKKKLKKSGRYGH